MRGALFLDFLAFFALNNYYLVLFLFYYVELRLYKGFNNFFV